MANKNIVIRFVYFRLQLNTFYDNWNDTIH